MDVQKRMKNLLKNIPTGTKEELIENRTDVEQIGDYCRIQKPYRQNGGEIHKSLFGKTALMSYHIMVKKIATTPFIVCAKMTAMMYMPVIADKLREEEIKNQSAA